MCLYCCQESIGCAFHEVASATAVYVDINTTRHDITTSRIYHFIYVLHQTI